MNKVGLFQEIPERYTHHTNEEIIAWLSDRKQTLNVNLNKTTLSDCKPWFYDEKEGVIRNDRGSFFSISGIRYEKQDKKIVQQPIILQEEIGFLGIICCKIHNVWHYLMQAKIEPGNVNHVQLSPTIQATKSNFTQKHGGARPLFLDYFLKMRTDHVLVDQIQSEQSSRFLGKRNRNVILISDELLAEPPSHKWITLSQMKELMKYDNLVNMDTRTVLSCIPYVLLGTEGDVPFKNKSYFFRTAGSLDRQTIVNLYHSINNYKMFQASRPCRIPLFSMDKWEMKDGVFSCKEPYPFHLIFCNIEIEGREVTNWNQPLFAAKGIADFGLICTDDGGILKFLVKVRPEIGCFDGAEIGPTVQREACIAEELDAIEHFFYRRLEHKQGILADVLLSEEGGRFYQEQNRNVILLVEKEEVPMLPEGYVWSDYGTLNILTQINNCLNIQLRNLLSILEIEG